MSRMILPNGQRIEDVSGGVKNPLEEDLDAAGFKIFGLQTLVGVAASDLIVEVPVGQSIIFKRPV